MTSYEGLIELEDGSLVEESLASDRYDRGDSRESARAPEDRRTEAERDVGRIRYSTALLRLGGVSQVVTPLPNAVRRHNRLTHSLKVAGLAREIANDLLRRARDEDSRQTLGVIREMGGLDVAACEAGGLSHDLGHAPFAHSTEDLIDQWLREAGDPCGFEGNAQSMRVVTKLEARRPGSVGFGLTAVTLAATAKYPWLRDSTVPGRSRKFSAYRADEDQLDLAQQALPVSLRGVGTRSLEAAIVDLADDVTYAIHDVQDFVEAGLIDMRVVLDDVTAAGRRLAKASASEVSAVPESRTGFESVILRIQSDPRFDLRAFAAALLYVSEWLREELLASSEPSSPGPLDIGVTRRAFSHLIAQILSTVEIKAKPAVEGSWVEPSLAGWHQLQVMKMIGRYYVIESPDVVFQERSHVAAVKALLGALLDWAIQPARHSLPQPLRTFFQVSDVGDSDSPALRRAIVDYLCTLSDRDCLDMATSLVGASSPAFSRFSISG